MGTRASISIKTSDGKFLKTAVNWDGYLSHVGKVLLQHFYETERIFDMINGGEIRSIDYIAGEVDVEYYDDSDSYPITTVDHEDEMYNYLYDPLTNKWNVSFYNYDEDEDESTEVNMELGEAIERYGHAH